MKFTFPPDSKPLPGYTIKRAIDRGGFGEVYYALSDAGKEVALKLLQHNLDVELRGVRQCLNLRHPNLITIFDIRTDNDEDHWIIMEYAGGKTLEQTLAAQTHPMPPAEALSWLRGIADGVEFLHSRGLVHRDLKPGNIFADQGTVKVGDVGLSKFITPSRRSAQTESVGTVHYMAPEVARGRYGNEVDVYAAGIILYEMLVGRVPFEGESTAEILMKHLTATPDLAPIPAGLRPLLARALEKDPERRLHSLTDLARGLEQFVAGEQPAIPPQTRETIQESIERHQAEAAQQPPLTQPVLVAASTETPVDELDHFWRHVSRFFRPERNFLRSIGGDLYRFWKRDVPAWIRWPVLALLMLLSPVWFLVLLASTPWLLFVSVVYFGFREAVRVAIWMVDPPPGTHPWTRLFGGNPSTVPVSHQPQPAHYQTPHQTPPTTPFVPEAPPASYPHQPTPVQQSPFVQPADSSSQIPQQKLGFIERWLGLPLLALAGFAGLLILDNLRDDDYLPLFWMIVVTSFLASLRITSNQLNRHAVSYENRTGINPLLLSLAGSATLLGFSGIEVLDVSNILRFNDEVMVGSLLSIGAGLASFLLIRRRLSLNAPLPHMPVTPQPIRQFTPAPAPFGFGQALLVTFLLLLALSVGSIILALFAYSTKSYSYVDHTGDFRTSSVTYSVDPLVPLLVVAGIIAAGFYFLRRRSSASQSPDAPQSDSSPASTKRRRSGEFWLITGFLTLWALFTFRIFKGQPLPLWIESLSGKLFSLSSWTSISFVVWAEILLLTLLISRLVPKIESPLGPETEPARIRLRLATGYLQSLLWSILLSAGFTLTIVALSDPAITPATPTSYWSLNQTHYTSLVWLFGFLALSSAALLTQSYFRTRFGFLQDSRFFTLLISGLLLAGIHHLLVSTIRQIDPLHVPSESAALQFFLPVMICGGWLGQIDPLRSSRFRLSRVICVSLVTLVVAGILEFDRPIYWAYLMGSLSCIVQLGSLWTDPEMIAAAPHTAADRTDRHYYNVSLVQGA